MAENKILPWAQTGTANVLSDADYAADVANGGSYADGVKSGQASSKQANKTWRQATAPGAGLGQFLVDNLSVDVTDADTPATFSARIANAVLKLAQVSPFNQAWASATGGYRKYAIVSDSSGNFWVSTADQNTTTPGADGAKWQSLFNGYATQAWTEGRYLQKASGSLDYTPLQAGINKSSGDIWLSYNDGTSVKYAFAQPAGDYATNPALNTEITNRTNADTNLQNQINNRVLKTGDTMNGTLTIVGEYGEALGYSWSEALILENQFSGSTAQILCTTQYGVDTAVRLKSTWGNNKNTVLDLHQDGTITTTYGTVAFQSDLGNYVSQSQYSNDFATSDSRVINLAWGHRIQAFQANVGNGTTAGSWVTFPQSFSAPPVFYCANSNGNNDINTDTDYWCYGATATGMYVRPRNHDGSANILVIGPK